MNQKKTTPDELSVSELARELHSSNARSLEAHYRALSKEQLLERCFIEMDAKNQAYHFIMKQGLMSEFRDFCLE